MANSRLFIYDPETKTATMIAKTMGSGWYLALDEETVNEFFEALDGNKGWGMADTTGLKLHTENSLPKKAKIRWMKPKP